MEDIYRSFLAKGETMDKVKTLKAFLEALKANGVTYNTKRVDSRLKIQKLVYLAQFFWCFKYRV
jgi:hypothetical protein